MTVLARTFISIPQRTATETWKAICRVLVLDERSDAGRELASVAGIASSLITREAMTSPIVVCGSGPRVRIYCLYNEDAVEGDGANENELPFSATEGDWRMSLPCTSDDLGWVQAALNGKSKRISARDMDASVDDAEDREESDKSSGGGMDLEAFFKL
jgi:hypothetical protein